MLHQVLIEDALLVQQLREEGEKGVAGETDDIVVVALCPLYEDATALLYSVAARPIDALCRVNVGFEKVRGIVRKMDVGCLADRSASV